MCYKSGFHHRKAKHYAKKYWRNQFMHYNYPAVNVEELDDRYEIYLFAAGYQKGDFEVATKDNTLIIGVDKSTDTNWDESNWRRQEFRPTNFERQFELNEKINKEAISAKYENGILQVTLPKLAGFETSRKDVQVV